ncbi:MAG: MYXO-CTERM sorting domain-containing protein, partial [Myxococcota bacterium]
VMGSSPDAGPVLDASVDADGGGGGDAAVADGAVAADGSTLTESSEGCGCRVTGPAAADVPVALLILLGLLARRRRWRSPTARRTSRP